MTYTQKFPWVDVTFQRLEALTDFVDRHLPACHVAAHKSAR